jgi:hypothetical protein
MKTSKAFCLQKEKQKILGKTEFKGMRYLAIGDIHGCSQALDSLLAVVKPQPDDLIITTLGDYINSGGGWLTCLDVYGGKVWQANQQGQIQIAHIEEFRAFPM